MEIWSLQDAKARFSEVVRIAKSKGPVKVTVRGQPEVVIISMKDYESLNAQKPSLMQLLRGSPLTGLDLDVKRSDVAREFEV